MRRRRRRGSRARSRGHPQSDLCASSRVRAGRGARARRSLPLPHDDRASASAEPSGGVESWRGRRSRAVLSAVPPPVDCVKPEGGVSESGIKPTPSASSPGGQPCRVTSSASGALAPISRVGGAPVEGVPTGRSRSHSTDRRRRASRPRNLRGRSPHRPRACENPPHMSERGKRLSVLIADDHPVYRQGLARAIKERAEPRAGRRLRGRPRRTRADHGLGARRRDRRRAHAGPRRAEDRRRRQARGPADARHPADRLRGLGRRLQSARRRRRWIRLEGLRQHGALRLDRRRRPRRDRDRAAVRGRHRDRDPAPRDDRPAGPDRARGRGPAAARRGRTAQKIGNELHLSEATIKTHLHNLYEKLDVSDRAAAVATAMRWGLLE